MKTLPLSLSDHLAAHSRIAELFYHCNLYRDLKEAVEAGSLYLPPSGERISHAWLCQTKALRSGYEGKSHAIEFGVDTVSRNFDDEETSHSRYISINVPVSLVDAYTLTSTHPYPANPAYRVEVMTFRYSKAAFNRWVKTERARLVKKRTEDLAKQIATLTAEAKALARGRVISR